MLRIQLINSVIGSLVLEKADPIDINSLTQTHKRSEEHAGVFYEVILDLEFIKDGRDFIKAAYENDAGIDTVTIVNLYERDTQLRKWKLAGTGQVNYNRFDLGEVDVVVAIEQTGIERRVLNMKGMDVDLETEESENGSALPPVKSFDVTWHSKEILKETTTSSPNDTEYQEVLFPDAQFPVTSPAQNVDTAFVWLGQFDNTKETFKELEDSFDLPYGFLPFPDQAPFGLGDTLGAAPGETVGEAVSINTFKTFLQTQSWKDVRNPILVSKEAGTLDVLIKLNYKHQIFAVNTGGDVDIPPSEGCMGAVQIIAWFEHRDKNDNVISLNDIGTWNMAGSGGNERLGNFEQHDYQPAAIAVNKGDKFYLYYTVRIYGEYERPTAGGDGFVTHTITIQPQSANVLFQFKNKTVDVDRTVKTIMIYEAIERCLEYYTNTTGCFKSNLLGRVDIGYAVDGPFSLIGLTNGHRLRQKNIDLPEGERGDNIFATLEELVQFVKTIACADFGFELDENGKKIFVLEPMEYFFNKNVRSVSLGRVYDIRRRLNPKRFYNQIEIGYSTDIDVKQVNATDEYNTIRRFRIPVINTKNQLVMTTDMITSGFLIENQKRLSASTEDGKYDDSNFASVMLRDGLTFKTKKNEGYAEINNVLYPATGYNYDISPARILPNWFKILASNLIRSRDKELKFTYGEVNYIMTTRKNTEVVVTSENGNVDIVAIEAIFDNEDYNFNHPVNRDQLQLIKANPYGYIEFQDKDNNVMEGFISPEGGIEYDYNKKTAEFNLIKVHRP